MRWLASTPRAPLASRAQWTSRARTSFDSAVGTAFALGMGPQDRWLCCLPLHHVAGLSILTRAAICGIGAVLHDGFDD